jgi:hypothetical protein
MAMKRDLALKKLICKYPPTKVGGFMALKKS